MKLRDVPVGSYFIISGGRVDFDMRVAGKTNDGSTVVVYCEVHDETEEWWSGDEEVVIRETAPRSI